MDAGGCAVGVRVAGDAGRAELGGVVPPDGVEGTGDRVRPVDRGSLLAGGDRVAGLLAGGDRVAGCDGQAGVEDAGELPGDRGSLLAGGDREAGLLAGGDRVAGCAGQAGVEDAEELPGDRGSLLAGGDRVAVADCEPVDPDEADDDELLGESQVEELECSDVGGLGVRNSSGSELSWYEEEDEVVISLVGVKDGVLCLVFFEYV